MKNIIIYNALIALALSFVACGGGGDEVTNQPPGDPYDPIPADGAVDVEMPVTLQWSSEDPDGDEMVYTVKIGDAPATKRKRGETDEKSYILDDLEPGTTYYWGIAVDDLNGGTTDAPNVPNYWIFTTAGEPPEEAVEEEAAEEETE